MTSPSGEWQLRTVPPLLEQRYLSEGWWNDASLGSVIANAVAEQPTQRMKVRSTVRPWEGTFDEVLKEAQHLAGALRARGIGAGDVVAFQLPNWKEAAVSFWAAAFLGAIVTPIVHFYGAKEVDYILRRTQVRALITADHFGHNDYLTVVDTLRTQAPDLEHVIVLSEDPVPSWAERFADVLEANPVTEPARVDPDAPALVAYTSGTTADPKGVVHSHRTICFEIEQLASMQTGSPPLLVGAPVGHGIGMLSGLLLPVHKREPINLIDVWDPGAVLAAMIEDNIASGSGSTYFLSSLLDHRDITPAHLKLMSRIGLGGSAVPVAVTERMTSLGISPVRSYGSTEHPSTSGARHEEPLDKRMHTDGHALLGVELRIVNDEGTDVAAGFPGEIFSRGPDCCIGYTEPTLTAKAFDADGWFHTEDVGVLDDEGWLTIVDRIKDVIIRGGENISALEVEEQLLRLPGVAEAAAVAAPDERLGEHVCALVRLTPGASAPDLTAAKSQFERAGLARQKWPEELRIVDDFPRTASGKVQKYLLRERLRAERQ
jgi:acyl-CoA synthetase